MNNDRWESLEGHDWGDAWETLPEAPPLVPRPKAAQITLRLSLTTVTRLKRVAAARSLPYHALARSWLIDAMREPPAHAGERTAEEPQLEQLNLKVDQRTLDALKQRGHELGEPYHRLARQWIEATLTREEERLGLDAASSEQPAVKDLIVFLLHATDKRGDHAVRGITRLQKLLFVIEQNLATQSRFYAFNYGPFSEEVNDAAHALQLAGFLRSAESVTSRPPSFAEMMATVNERSGPNDNRTPEEFELTDRGHEAAERLRRANAAYDQLYEYVRAIRREWDTPDLLERVYETWPKYTERSIIRDQLAARRRRGGGTK